MSNWIISIILLILLIVVFLAYRHVKRQLRQEQTETARLHNQVAAVEHQLAEINSRRKKLLAASTQALAIVEKDYTISSSNKVARHLFGGKPGQDTTLMAWTRQHQLKELVDQVLQGHKMPRLYFNLGDQSLEARARAIKEDDKVVAVALSIHDVTELQRLSRARRDLVANISHELRTPLASIQLLTDTLLNGALDDRPKSFELVKKIAGQVDLLSQLARELLDLSLIESGQMPLKLDSYPLRPLAQAQINHLLPQAERKHIALTLEIEEDTCVLADETMLGRVITNLLHNAIKFTDMGSIILSAQRSEEITTTPDGQETRTGWVTVSIADTGIGIPPDELARIFERFYKVDPARNVKGTGLGLAIAKHIIEAHGGRIWVESSGHGSTFYFTVLAG